MVSSQKRRGVSEISGSHTRAPEPPGGQAWGREPAFPTGVLLVQGPAPETTAHTPDPRGQRSCLPGVVKGGSERAPGQLLSLCAQQQSPQPRGAAVGRRQAPGPAGRRLADGEA